MSKAYQKQRFGKIQGSLVAPEVFPTPHSPEEEQTIQKLVEQLRPFLMQSVNEAINIYVDESYDIQEGNFVQYVINYITNYIDRRVIGALYKAGNGIKISGETISVRDGEGLEADDGDLNIDLATDPGLQITGDKLEAKCNAAAAVSKGSSGIKLLLSENLLTGEAGTGGGLSFDESNGVRVAPEDFLVLS